MGERAFERGTNSATSTARATQLCSTIPQIGLCLFFSDGVKGFWGGWHVGWLLIWLPIANISSDTYSSLLVV